MPKPLMQSPDARSRREADLLLACARTQITPRISDRIRAAVQHLREHGSIALDMGVHFTDLFQYYLGDFGTVFGDSFIAEPVLSSGGVIGI